MDLERKLRKPKKEAQKIIVIFFGICTGFALWVTFDMPPDEEVDGNAENIGDSYKDYPAYDFKSAKKILYYTPRYGKPDWNMGEGNEPFHRQVSFQNIILL